MSVVIPSYNYERYIEACLRSVLAQSFQDFEVVVVDDGSTDNSCSIIRKYLADPRVRLIENPRNLGISSTQNRGIEESSGEFVCILNSDDYWLPEKLAEQVAFLDAHPDYAAVLDIPELVDENSEPIDSRSDKWTGNFIQQNRPPEEWIRHLLIKGNCLCHPSSMIRRSCHDLLGVYDPRFACGHDFDLWIRMLVAGHRFHILESKNTHFRLHGQNSSSNNSRDRMHLESYFVLRNISNISDGDLFFRTFPECKKMGDWDPRLAKYYFGRFVIENIKYKKFSALLASNLLWDFASDSQLVELAIRKSDFSWPFFHKLMKEIVVTQKKNRGKFRQNFKIAKTSFQKWNSFLKTFGAQSSAESREAQELTASAAPRKKAFSDQHP